MEEIKFRGWSKYAETMYPWDKMENSSDNYLKENFDGPLKSGITLLQFTGLKDKNGKEIYEGDILTHRYDIGSPFAEFERFAAE